MSCNIGVSWLQVGHLYSKMYMHHKYGCSQPCLIVFTNYTFVTHDNYITTKVNVILNQWLFCN
jgi:hypothetical protein